MIYWHVLALITLSWLGSNAQRPVTNNSPKVREVSPLVKTLDGPLRGAVLRSRNGERYYAFRGIKYGEIPARFEAATDITPWTSVMDVSDFGARCPHISMYTGAIFSESEDCLFLNIYVPADEDLADLPVLFWIHGEGFVDGAGSHFGADFFMDEKVVLVTINYRLGIVGFLNTEDDTVSPNNGLKDIILALKWIKRNVGKFGGSSEKVTIFGQSSGASLAHLLMLSPAAKGLFRSVIAQSGTALAPWALTTSPREKAVKMARKLSCPTESMKAMVQCFRSKEITELLTAQRGTSLHEAWIDVMFGPSVDKVSINMPTGFSVIPDHPLELLTDLDTNSRQVPLLLGTNEKEGTILLASALQGKSFEDVLHNWTQWSSRIFGYGNYVPKGEIEIFASTLRSIYAGQNADTDQAIDWATSLCSDFFFRRGARISAELHSQFGSRVFPYFNTYHGDFSRAQMMGLANEGPTHSDDLRYFFPSIRTPMKDWPDLKPNTADEEFSKKLIFLWVSFAANGVPSETSEGRWEHLNATELGRINFPVMKFDTMMKVTPEKAEDFARITHMDSLFASYEKPPLSWKAKRNLRDEL